MNAPERGQICFIYMIFNLLFITAYTPERTISLAMSNAIRLASAEPSLSLGFWPV